MNFIKGKIIDIQNDNVTIIINNIEKITIKIPQHQLQHNQKITIGIRPEHLSLEPIGDVQLCMHNEVTERLGNATYLFGTFSGVENFKVFLSGDNNPKPYTNIKLSLHSRDCHIFDEKGLRIN